MLPTYVRLCHHAAKLWFLGRQCAGWRGLAHVSLFTLHPETNARISLEDQRSAVQFSPQELVL